MKKCFFYYLTIFFSTINASELIVFNVGQGNCNLFTPDQSLSAAGGKGVPILYDAGSFGGRPSNEHDVKIDKNVIITEIVSKIKSSLPEGESSLNGRCCKKR